MISQIANSEVGSSVRTKLNTVIDRVNLGAFKIYRALISQSGASDPTATVLANSIGAIAWARGSAGSYTATLAGAFLAGKVFILVGPGLAGTPDPDILYHVSALRASNDVISVLTHEIDVVANTITLADAVLTITSIEIAVYE